MKKANATRTAAQIQQEFEDCAGELTAAIKALIRGYLPAELRAEPFTVTLRIDHDGKFAGADVLNLPARLLAERQKSGRRGGKKKGGAA